MQIPSSYVLTQGLSQCTDKNMIPTCAQNSAACDWLTINF